MSTSVREFGKAWWAELCNRIIGAVVFLDDYSAECLHWDGGLFNLLNGGAVAVKSLSIFECCKTDQKKAVFITHATSTQLRTISEIIRTSDLTHCILVSCVSLDIVYSEINDGFRDVSDVVASGKAASEGAKLLERRLLEWINKKQSVVEVVYIPIFTIAPTNNVFLTPPFQRVFPKFENKLTTDTPSLDLYSLSSKERSYVRRLASGLNSMLDSMNMKEDIYYMGAYSSLVAGVLENSPICMSRRKYPTPAISVPAIRAEGKNDSSTPCDDSDAANDSVTRQQLNTIPPGSLPDSANELSKPSRALVIRLLERDPKLRMRNLRQLQQSAFYLGFNFEHVKTKKVSPKYVLENHIANSNSADLLGHSVKKHEFLEFHQDALL